MGKRKIMEGVKSGTSSKRNINLQTPLTRAPSGINHYMKSVKYEQLNEESEDPNGFAH